MRKYFALVLSVVILIPGVRGLYFLFFEAPRIPFMSVFAAGFWAAIGAYVLRDTLQDWAK